MSADPREQAGRLMRRAAIASVSVSAVLVTIKTYAYFASHSVALLASLVIYDWLSLKKIHGATIASIIMAGLLHMAGSWIAVTELGQDLVRKLG